MNRASIVQWRTRGRGAFAAIAIHAALVSVVMWLDVETPGASPPPLLVSIVEWPEVGSNAPTTQSAPDFSPAPPENAAASEPTESIPTPTSMDVMENAARLADPSAPDRPADAQDAPYADISRGPSEPRDLPAPRRAPRPRVTFENPYLNTPPGPAQRGRRAVQLSQAC